MFTKRIFSILFFITLLSCVFALTKRSNDCDELGKLDGVGSCETDDAGEVTSISLSTSELSQDVIEKVCNYTSIDFVSFYAVGNSNITSFEPFSILTNLTRVSFGANGLTPVASGLLKNLKSVKELEFSDMELNQENIDEISTLTDLEVLSIRHSSCDPSIDYSSLKNLINLKKIYMEAYEYHHHRYYKRLTEFPEFIFDLTNLTAIFIGDQEFTKIPDKFSNLKKLELISLTDCPVDDTLPQSLNTLPELNTVFLGGLANLKGKTLTNPKLERCNYSESYDLCKAKEMDCLKLNGYQFKDCPDIETDDEKDDDHYSTNGQCGNGNGKCPPGFCCSKHGWCGKTDDHCSVAKGCQFQLGTCKNEPEPEPQPEPQPEPGRCGKGYGKCLAGQCCSKDGYCGVNDSHCLVSNGCQSEFGVCFKLKYTVDGSCGPEAGRCPAGQCCSKYGWCGRGTYYCDAGCQSAYGLCNNSAFQ